MMEEEHCGKTVALNGGDEKVGLFA